MGEGMSMLLVMLAAVFVLIIAVFRTQYRIEKHWDEEDMICPKKDKRSEDGYDE